MSKGRVHQVPKRDLWYVQWGNAKIYRYKGEVCKDDKKPGYGSALAHKLLFAMRADYEDNREGFRVEKYTHGKTDVIPYLRTWLKSQKPDLSPATYHDYLNSVEKHLIPWFMGRAISLNEIQYDTLCALMNDIKRDGKGKLNVMYALHACLKYAWKSSRILSMPPFPEKKKYNIQEKAVVWISEERQRAIIDAIPVEHQPIFWWLKYHLRRPSEAIALHKEDYDAEQDCFTIRRGVSRKILVSHTKTHKVHIIPCHPEFKVWITRLHQHFGPYYFTHSASRLAGKRYQSDYLVDAWNRAARSCGETIRMYAGLKHSSCSQFINELGGTIDELQMLTGHTRRDSVLHYAQAELASKRRIMGRVYGYKTATPKKEPSEAAES
jgi:integrase